MSDEATTTEAEAEAVELKRQTWRVLKRDEATVAHVTRWKELEPLSGEGEYGYRPDADALGKAYGEGDYLLIELDPAAYYLSARTMTVEAERYYHERRDDAPDESDAGAEASS